MELFNIFKKWGSAVIFVIATYDVIVSQFIPLDVREKYHIATLGWSWQIWVIILLVLLVLAFVFAFVLAKKSSKPKAGVEENHYDAQKNGIATRDIIKSLIVKAESNGYAAGRDLIITHPNQANEESAPKTELEITAKKMAESFARLGVKNIGETTAVKCYGRIHKIIRRDLRIDTETDETEFMTARGSFISWSGGSDEGRMDIVRDSTEYLNVAELLPDRLVFRMQKDNPEWYQNSEFAIEIHVGCMRGGHEVETIKDTYQLIYQRAYHENISDISTSDNSPLVSEPINYTKLYNFPDFGLIEWKKIEAKSNY